MNFCLAALSALIITSCSGMSTRNQNEWDNIDYTSVYRAYGGRENDTRYKSPTIIGCMDEDLYNCSK